MGQSSKNPDNATMLATSVRGNLRFSEISTFKTLRNKQQSKSNEIPIPTQEPQIPRLASASALPAQVGRCNRSRANAALTRKAFQISSAQNYGHVALAVFTGKQTIDEHNADHVRFLALCCSIVL